jgi:alkylation response protein AidB-like acyl-CoA dehydrogenase
VDSLREAMLILGGNGIVEDFTVLPRLFRDAMIIETWEGPPNTLCLQIVRDAARSNLLPMFQSEISGTLERWEKDFLSHTRQQFEQQFNTLNKALVDNATNKGWFEANARRLVDAMGSLLEIAWLVQMAARHRELDATTALMASLCGRELFDEGDFNHPASQILQQYGSVLIDEQPILSAPLQSL